MQLLKGEHIYLRALEPEDIDFLMSIENDTAFWEVSNTQVPFSRFTLEQYITNSNQDIYSVHQLRLIVATISQDEPVGMIDLFDFNPQHSRAGIGILITQKHQRKGYANEALKLLVSYAFNTLNLHQLYANITTDNVASLQLFKNHDFKKVGIKKEWIFTQKDYKDEVLFQRINR